MSRNPALDLPKSQMYRDMAALGFYDLEGDRKSTRLNSSHAL